jgi:acyl-CoA dehydrogenase family protein 10
MNIIIKRRSLFIRVSSSPLLAHRTLIDTSHSPLSNVRTAHKFEESKLISYLKSKDVLPKEGTSINFKQFTHGQSNPTFILEVDGADKERIIVRKQPPGKLLKGAHAVDREYRVMTALSSDSSSGSNVPVPKTLLNCLDSEIIGTPFFCYKFVDGRFYKSPQLPSVDPARKHAMYKGMLDTLAKIHSIDVDQCGLGDYGVRMGTVTGDDQTPPVLPYVQRQVKTWSRQYKSTETETIEDMEDLMKNLPRLLPHNAEDHSCLVHGDYRMDNLIFNIDEDTVAAVLDWELSTLGDRLSDLAYNSIVYHLDPSSSFVAGLKGLDLEKEGIPSQHEAIRYYGERLEFHSKGRLSAPSAKELDYYLAFSFFRVCAILQGVYKRSLQGNASADNANSALAFAKETAKLGNDLLKKYEHEVNIGELSLEGVHLENGVFKSSKPVQQLSQMNDLLVAHEIDIIPKSTLFQHLISPKANILIEKISHFIIDRIMPAENFILNHMYESPNKWDIHPMMEELKVSIYL